MRQRRSFYLPGSLEDMSRKWIFSVNWGEEDMVEYEIEAKVL
jgi:hypothetical protein